MKINSSTISFKSDNQIKQEVNHWVAMLDFSSFPEIDKKDKNDPSQERPKKKLKAPPNN